MAVRECTAPLEETTSNTNNMMNNSSMVCLNVGGTIHYTTKTTLLSYPDSMLGKMFTTEMRPTEVDKCGNYFIDRDGSMFRHILNFLRSNRLVLPEDFSEWELLEAEADYYQIPPLIEAVAEARSEFLAKKSEKELRKNHESGDYIEIRETHTGRSKDFREQIERVHMMFIGKWCYINEFRVFLQNSRLADGTEGLPGVQCMIYGDYCEMSWTSEEQYFRIKLGDYLSRTGWKHEDSRMVISASDYYSQNRNNSKVDSALQKVFRDRWFKVHSKQ